MSNYYKRRRTILMPKYLSDQLSVASASEDVHAEELIHRFITEGLQRMAEQDDTLKLMFYRAAGIDWDTLTEIARRNTEKPKTPVIG